MGRSRPEVGLRRSAAGRKRAGKRSPLFRPEARIRIQRVVRKKWQQPCFEHSTERERGCRGLSLPRNDSLVRLDSQAAISRVDARQRSFGSVAVAPAPHFVFLTFSRCWIADQRAVSITVETVFFFHSVAIGAHDVFFPPKCPNQP